MPLPQNPGAILKRLEKMRDGLKKRFPKGTEKIVFNGDERPAATVLDRVNECIRIYKRPELAHRELTTAIQARTQAKEPVRRFMGDLQAAIIPYYGPSNQDLTLYGIPPKKKPKKLTVEKSLERARKAAITRGMRHTMGKNQKKNIKAGNIQPPPSDSETKKRTQDGGKAP